MARIQIPRPRMVVREANGKRLTDVIHEVTGHRGGIKIEHPDGRVEAVVTPPTITKGFEILDMTMSDFKRQQYGRLREQGHSHEAALLMLPNR